MKELLGMILHSFEVYTIIYKGKIYSGNDDRSNSWRTKAGVLARYKQAFSWLIKEAKLPWFEQFGLVVYYNSRHDPDNIATFSKTFTDAFKQIERKGEIVQKGYVRDDSKKHYKLFAIVPDDSLDNNTFKFTLIKLK